MQIFVSNAKTELSLLVTLQNFCYDDARVTKQFHKFVTIFYKLDIVSEAAIMYWASKGASQKGKGLDCSLFQRMEGLWFKKKKKIPFFFFSFFCSHLFAADGTVHQVAEGG